MLRGWRPGALARNSAVVLGWNIARLATQLLWVVLLARLLGAAGYGAFSGISSLAIALSGLAGVGLGLRLYQDVIRDPALFPLRWAQATRALVVSGIALAAGFCVLGQLAFPQWPWWMVGAIALAELCCAPAVQQLVFALAAVGRMRHATALPLMLSIARVLAVLLLPFNPLGQTLAAYATLHLLMTAAAALLAWRLATALLTPSPATALITRQDLAQGLSFSSVWASGLALVSVDKALALRVGGAEIAGHYTAACRMASIAALPVDALVTAVMPRLFLAGSGQLAHGRLLASLLAVTLGYGLCAGVALWLAAPLLPLVVGEGFRGAVPALHVVAAYVPAYCLRSLGTNVLLGYGWKRWRCGADLVTMAVLAVLMLCFIPRAGAVGAAYALVCSEVLLVALVWWRVGQIPRQPLR